MKKNPNHVNASRDDAKNSMATCPLMKSTMQLVPLCYVFRTEINLKGKLR